MCGITGAVARNEHGRPYPDLIDGVTDCLAARGPDDRGVFRDGDVALGHRRLSVIDTSAAAGQPMQDPAGRYVIVFNGEFFNYREHRERLLAAGVPLRTASDTEVLLHLYAREGASCLRHVNGFFAFAVYDRQQRMLFLARDRFGIKPLLVYESPDAFLFASEMKALLAFGIPRHLDRASLHTYLQLNYIPQPATILRDVRKVRPGCFIRYDVATQSVLEEKPYYEVPLADPAAPPLPYGEACRALSATMERAVQRRLVSDVPLGSFLSGGIDSSIVSALAARHTPGLRTFSIGFRDAPYYDETEYALMVAAHLKTEHTVFQVTRQDLLDVVYDVLDYLDEPFADSSALNVFLLSRHTRKEVTVALSGDGGDELFAGYNKHRAEWILRHRRPAAAVLKVLYPFLRGLHGSRGSRTGNAVRQLRRFSEGAWLGAAERYWRWCGTAGEADATRLLRLPPGEADTAAGRKAAWLQYLDGDRGDDFNRVLYSDVKLILPGDMLAKVDLMSMANSLEVRTPFLDYEVADLAFALPAAYKIDRRHQKKILKDTFAPLLPPAIMHRGKKGFEVPLLPWFRGELRSLITDDLLSDAFIREQQLFDPAEIRRLRHRLFSSRPGEIQARVWGLVVFQYWWKKYMRGWG